MKKLASLLILCINISIFGQTVNSKTETPYIEVVGKVEKEIIPNEVYIDITIKERIEKGKKLAVDFLENQLKNELKTIGVPEENLSISDLNAMLAKTSWWRKEILSVANYSLKVSDASKLKELFSSFNRLKISDVHISRATHSDIIALKKENRIAAIKAAKAKADYLLNAIGEKTGKPMIVNEVENGNYNNIGANSIRIRGISSYNSYSKMSSKNTNVQFEKIKISSSVYVKFRIQ